MRKTLKLIDTDGLIQAEAPSDPNTGIATEAFTVIYRDVLVQFARGQRVEVDPDFAKFLADMPVAWGGN